MEMLSSEVGRGRIVPVPDSLMLALSRAFVPDCAARSEVMTARRSPALSVVFQNWQFLILATDAVALLGTRWCTVG